MVNSSFAYSEATLLCKIWPKAVSVITQEYTYVLLPAFGTCCNHFPSNSSLFDPQICTIMRISIH